MQIGCWGLGGWGEGDRKAQLHWAVYYVKLMFTQHLYRKFATYLHTIASRSSMLVFVFHLGKGDTNYVFLLG